MRFYWRQTVQFSKTDRSWIQKRCRGSFSHNGRDCSDARLTLMFLRWQGHRAKRWRTRSRCRSTGRAARAARRSPFPTRPRTTSTSSGASATTRRPRSRATRAREERLVALGFSMEANFSYFEQHELFLSKRGNLSLLQLESRVLGLSIFRRS